MVAQSATNLACVSGVRSKSSDDGYEVDSPNIANAGAEFTKGVLIASGVSLVLWGSVIGAISRFIR